MLAHRLTADRPLYRAQQRPYIHVRDAFLILWRAQDDAEAARELEIRNANADRRWHVESGWPRWERKP